MIAPTWQCPVAFPEAATLAAAAPQLLADHVRAHPEQVLVVDPGSPVGTEFTGSALLGQIAQLQYELRRRGVGAGDVVCAQLPNWVDSVALAFAVWGIRGVLCPVPTNFRRSELRAILRACADRTQLRAVVVPHGFRSGDHARVMADAQADAGTDAPILPLRDPAVQLSAESGSSVELRGNLDDVCMVMFTSGTTGIPKGVLHSHRTLLADAASIASLFAMDGDRVYMPSPVGHVTGLVYGVLMPLLMNGSCLLHDTWDARAAVSLIEKYECTTCVGATPFLRGLTDEYRTLGQPSGLRSFVCGGADIPAVLVREARAVLGTAVTRAYGLTEMPTVTCGGPDDPLPVITGSDGRLTGSSQARLTFAADTHGGAGDIDRGDIDRWDIDRGDIDRGVGEHGAGVGELEVRGPELCLGYLDPAHTAAAFTADGWFRTGDLARLTDDGVITIVGRVKDLIVRGGENIGAKEVEDHLLDHPAVRDVVLVGIPDEFLGERACAVVVVATGPAPALRDLTDYLLALDIAKHKLPEYLLTVPQLPRTVSGKVQKFLVRQDAVLRLAAGQGEHR